jgi:Na+/H+ antiporter NhaD/arsenite permease-like protein
VVSALLMLARLRKAMRYAVREEEFLPVLSAGAFLVVTGTVAFAVGSERNIVDAFYFAVSTLTTTSVADPDLVLDDGWMKVFAVLYQLVGIGILVEILRRLGFGFVTVRAQERASTAAGEPGPAPKAGPDSAE